MDEAVEFFTTCADVQIVSASTLDVDAIPKYTIGVDGRGGGTAGALGVWPEMDYHDHPVYGGHTYWQVGLHPHLCAR